MSGKSNAWTNRENGPVVENGVARWYLAAITYHRPAWGDGNADFGAENAR